MESCQYNYVQTLHCYIMYNLYVFWKVISDGLRTQALLTTCEKAPGYEASSSVCTRLGTDCLLRGVCL